jgi:hypothetical protein
VRAKSKSKSRPPRTLCTVVDGAGHPLLLPSPPVPLLLSAVLSASSAPLVRSAQCRCRALGVWPQRGTGPGGLATGRLAAAARERTQTATEPPRQ